MSPGTNPVSEPSLSDLLADPIIQMVMHRDGVSTSDILQLFDRLQRKGGGGTTASANKPTTAN